jgi:hypothetical protein
LSYDLRVAVVRAFSQAPETDRLLRTAIGERRLIAFTLHNLPRRAEPHDYGIVNGAVKLFFYQVGGHSRSGRPIGWRWALIHDIRDLHVLDVHFHGPRNTPSQQHTEWDLLMASVSRKVS